MQICMNPLSGDISLFSPSPHPLLMDGNNVVDEQM